MQAHVPDLSFHDLLEIHHSITDKKYNIIIKTNLNRREFVPGSLFAEADHFLQPKVIRPDQLLQLKVIRPDQFLPGSIFA